MDTKLQAALDELIGQKTFSLEAVEAIKAMSDENAALKLKLETSTKALDDKTQESIKYQSTLGIVKDELKKLQDREFHLDRREAEITKLECSVITEKAVAAAYKDAMQIVFKNPVMQQSTFGQTVLPGANGCASYLTGVAGGSTTQMNP